MIAAINNVVPHVNAGKMRALFVTSPQRLTGDFANVPTLRELGLDVVQTGWTVVMGPKGVPAAPVRYWEDLLVKSVQHEDWQTYRLANYWDDRVTRSADTQHYLAREYEAAKRVLTDLGLAAAAKQ